MHNAEAFIEILIGCNNTTMLFVEISIIVKKHEQNLGSGIRHLGFCLLLGSIFTQLSGRRVTGFTYHSFFLMELRYGGHSVLNGRFGSNFQVKP